VTVSVRDGQGGAASQTFFIDVLAADTPPAFSNFDPPTLAGANVAYAYQVQAGDDDSPLPVTYEPLITSPSNSNITISSTGLIQWTPTSADIGTVETITVTVDDFAGLTATETYKLTVQSAAPGNPPAFSGVPTPPDKAAENYLYSYDTAVTYTAGDSMSYAVTSSPVLSDLTTDFTITPTTTRPGTDGLAIAWTPSTADYNTGQDQPVQITLTATDNTLGLQSFFTFPVTITNDTPPSINNINPQTITAGLTFTYQVSAPGATGFALLGTVPSGMTIDRSGLITWPTGIPDIGQHSGIEVEAFNADGLTATTPAFSITVNADTQPPTVQIAMSSGSASASSPGTLNANESSLVYFDVIASDAVGVTALSLTVGNATVGYTTIPLSADGKGQYVAPASPETFTVTATAANAAGLQDQATATLQVVDPTDTKAPSVGITAPTPDSLGNILVTAPTEIDGYVSDTNLVGWELQVESVNAGPNTNPTTIASGTSTIGSVGNGGDLGLFDPTNLANGTYTVTLTAWNAGGHVNSTSITVSVNGYLKLGNLHLSFTDLTVPIAGIPITITRTYDSLNADTQGDFGYGWTLSEEDYQLSVDAGNGASGNNPNAGLSYGERVLITKPDGTIEGFTFKPQVILSSQYSGSMFYTPKFYPDSGVTDQLTVQTDGPYDTLSVGDGGIYIGGDGSTPYNPANSLFGGTYTLTTQPGLTYVIDGTTGQVDTESDRHGNTLSFEPDAITWSNSYTGASAPAVQIVRDPSHGNRVTEIIDPIGTSSGDPTGHTIVYGYNPVTGDLISVTDRDGNITQFAYSAAQPHFLDQITDAMGNTVMAGQYDPSGRLDQITNATGQSATLTYDPANLTESATAPGNNKPTTNYYTPLGLLSESIDPNGIVTSYSYDQNDFLDEKVVDPTGHRTDGVMDRWGQTRFPVF
jgi:YD repeat-containing protein